MDVTVMALWESLFFLAICWNNVNCITVVSFVFFMSFLLSTFSVHDSCFLIISSSNPVLFLFFDHTHLFIYPHCLFSIYVLLLLSFIDNFLFSVHCLYVCCACRDLFFLRQWRRAAWSLRRIERMCGCFFPSVNGGTCQSLPEYSSWFPHLSLGFTEPWVLHTVSFLWYTGISGAKSIHTPAGGFVWKSGSTDQNIVLSYLPYQNYMFLDISPFSLRYPRQSVIKRAILLVVFKWLVSWTGSIFTGHIVQFNSYRAWYLPRTTTVFHACSCHFMVLFRYRMFSTPRWRKQ